MTFDSDLTSIQQVRDLIAQAKAAQKEFAEFSQEQVDAVITAMAQAGSRHAERLARMAVDETGMGKYEDKIIKNKLAAEVVYKAIKALKTVGFIREDHEKKIFEVAVPVGIIGALTPTTNPTSTVMNKILISLKSRNAIVFSPHPRAWKCSQEAASILSQAAVAAGAPQGLIGCVTSPTIHGTNELLRHPDITMILATGGAGMVKAAYSSGKPALGVGPGNVPAYIERSADIGKAVRDILAGKTFDNGTICSSEQAIVTEEVIAAQVRKELERQGGYFLNADEIRKIEAVVVLPTGAINPKIVGKSAQHIATLAGIHVPDTVRVLVAELQGVGPDYPMSREKLSPMLAFYVERDWHAACLRCIEILEFGGLGHSLVMHSNNDEIIREFALRKPISRMMVNTPSPFGTCGLTTSMTPSLTLGCGAIAGNSTSDNVSPLHLLNKKYIAYATMDAADVSFGESASPAPASSPLPGNGHTQITEEQLREIVERVVHQFIP